MKNIVIIIIATLFASASSAQVLGSYGVTRTASTPVHNPGAQGSKFAYDTTSLTFYIHKSGTVWEAIGKGLDENIGCVKPLYTPTKFDATVVFSMDCDSIWHYRAGAWHCSNCAEGADNWGGQTVEAEAPLKGEGTTGNPLRIDQAGATLGQALKWDGTAWAPANDENTGAAYTAGAGIDITDTTITNTGDLSNTNELQTISTGTNTLTLSNSGGTVTVDTDPTNDITSLSGGTGISVSGSGNSRAITNTGDLSNTNELQTLSISNDTLSISDGNSVVLPGGGATWPLLAPNGTALSPSYSFENATGDGIWIDDFAINITVSENTYGRSVNIQSGNATDPAEGGGSVGMSAGSGAGGGGIQLIAGNGSSDTGGNVDISGGAGVTGGFVTITSGAGDTGGDFNLQAGDGLGNGGAFGMRAGNGVTGGAFTMNAGNGELGGTFAMYAGSSSLAGFAGGGFGIYSGYGEAGGPVSISSSDGDTGGGNIFIVCGGGNDIGGKIDIIAGPGYGGASTGGDLNIVGGEGTTGGNVNISGGAFAGLPTRGNIKIDYAIEYTPITQAVRDSNTPVSGKTVFCSNCTANDSSTGVLQTYNGSTWKNHW